MELLNSEVDQDCSYIIFGDFVVDLYVNRLALFYTKSYLNKCLKKGLEKAHVKLGHQTHAKNAIGKSKKQQKKQMQKEVNSKKKTKTHKKGCFCFFWSLFFQQKMQKNNEKQLVLRIFRCMFLPFVFPFFSFF